MYKITITGKANTGKNTLGELVIDHLHQRILEYKDLPISNFRRNTKYIAFADPLKKMARIAFPIIPRKWLYGSSKYRAEVIPGAFKEGVPLTVRQLLIDLGNDFGRKYQSDLWIRNLEHRVKKFAKGKAEAVVVTDCRFRNEFDFLKSAGFFQIRLLRDSHTKINDVSETNQDGILDSEFDYVVNNNGTMNDLIKEAQKISDLIKLEP
jgi:hypothetical protein